MALEKRTGGSIPGRRRALTGLAVVSILYLPACEAVERRQSLVTVRDSAGVRIVENPEFGPGEHGAGWRILPDPTVTMGLVEGPEEYQFSFVRGAVRLSDGHMVVLDGLTNQLRFSGVEGTHLATAGGRGGGPGEFEGPTQLVRLPGDTLQVWDVSRQTRSWFDPEGRFTASQRADRGRWQGLFGPDVATDVTALLPDGSLLLQIRPVRPAASLGWYRSPLGFARAAADFSSVDSIGWYLGSEHYNVGTETQPLLRFVHFGRDTRFAAGGDPMRLFMGGMEPRQDGYEIHVYRPEGGLEGIIRHGLPARPVREEEVERAKDLEHLIHEEHPEPRSEAYVAEQLRTLPVPGTVPPHGDLHVDAEGFLWVQEWQVVPSQRRRYRIFGPEGRLLGSLEIPERLRVTDIGADYVLGVWTDENDVEFIHIYALQRGA